MTVNTASEISADRALKRERLCSLLHAEDSSVWLSSPAAVAWYLDGARIHTSLVGPPVAGVLVGRDVERVVSFSNEADRLAAEELPAGLELHTVPWHAPLESALVDIAGLRREVDMESEIRAARAALLPRELARFEQLCAETAALLTTHLTAFTSRRTERELAAEISAGIVGLGADPVVVMIAGATRLTYRHPLPTDAPVGNHAMIVVCARRHGLIANLTRWVRIGAARTEDLERERRMLAVEAVYLGATRQGRTLDQVFREGAAAYAENGFDAEEWQNHHQGGAAGYAGRDPRATPETPDVIQDQQAFAWNPSAPGAKVEDTVLLDRAEIRPLTVDPSWPSVTVNGIPRPVTLEV